jgi:osmotically-inducible protein OsmY
MGKDGGWRMAAWLTLAFLAGGCSREDTDRLGRVGRLTAAKLEAATGGAQGKIVSGWQALRGSLGDTTPESRVFLRLHWDKMLAGLHVRVTATDPGVVRLEGTVASFDQRSRAVGLAHTTEGVQEVIDALTVGKP